MPALKLTTNSKNLQLTFSAQNVRNSKKTKLSSSEVARLPCQRRERTCKVATKKAKPHFYKIAL
jgi:hypothetical protein